MWYVDDILVISYEPMKTIDIIIEIFKLKRYKASEPDMYIDAQFIVTAIDNGNKC